MARYRQYRSRRPNYRNYKRLKKGYKTGGLWGLAKKAASGVVKYYLNPEYKFLEAINTITPVTTGKIQPLSIIPQGDQNTQRSGNEIKVTSLLMRATMSKATAATSTKIRLIIFSDVSSNGALPALADVLQTANQDSPINRVNGTRFTVLCDKSYIVDGSTPKKQLYIYKKLQHHIHYLTTDNTNASLGQGQIYLAAITDEATNAPTISYNSRMRFLDN